jgi:hypothetical protein
MQRWKTVLALSALSLLLVPLASGSKATVRATAVISGSGLSYSLAVTNTGDEVILQPQVRPRSRCDYHCRHWA